MAIILPRDPYRVSTMFPTALEIMFNRVRHKQRMDIIDRRQKDRELEIKAGREFGLEQQGYTPAQPSAPEGTPPEVVVPEMGSGGPVRPDVTVPGGKGYMRPAGKTGEWGPMPPLKVPGLPDIQRQKNKRTGKIEYWQGKAPKSPLVTVNTADQSLRAAKEDAAKELGGAPGATQPIDAVGAAKQGTGPYATLAAAFDAVVGGVGIDALFGKEGFFKDQQDARQKLRMIKQTGKMALMNSARGAVYEQKIIDRLFPDPDKMFRNPATEARKITILRGTLQRELESNNRQILRAIDVKEVQKLRSSNTNIRNLLEMIGESSAGGQQAQMPTVTNAEEYNNIQPGQQYKDPNGKIRIKR